MTSKQHKTPDAVNRADGTGEELLTHRVPIELTDRSTLFEPYRQELLLHCYRLLGSLLDAEDMVQETMLRAWQRFDTFQGASSLRTWLYAIATNACLNALKKRAPRTLPLAAAPESDPSIPPAPALAEALWLEPFPDSWLAEAMDNPEARYTRRESVSLAFLTVLHLLPPRQRAILLLSDVLDWHASEVARLLEMSVSAVNSALHRARVTLEQHYPHPDARERAAERSSDDATRALLSRYVQAWENDDVAGLIALLREDATFSMPPFPSWYRGHDAIRAILTYAPGGRSAFLSAGKPHQWRLAPTHANGQVAFACYRFDQTSGFYHAFGMHIVTFDESAPTSQIADLLIFKAPSLVACFGFPLQLQG